MKFDLRQDQLDFCEAIRGQYKKGKKRVLAKAETGFGKTYSTAHLFQKSTDRGNHCVFVVHLDSILSRTQKNMESLGLRVGRIQSDHEEDPEALVQLCSMRTLDLRGVRPKADFFVVDEAHHWVSASAKRIIADYPNAHILGLTATPGRADDKPLGDIFESMIEGPSMKTLIEQGVLVQPVVVCPPNNASELAMHPLDALEKYTKDRHCTAVFLSSVADARALKKAYGDGSRIWVDDTKASEREEIEREIESGACKVLFSVNAILEGFDAPKIDCVMIARGMSSTVTFLQSVGRGLRKAKNKEDCLVIDLTGAAIEHGLPEMKRRWSLGGKKSSAPDEDVTIRRCPECWALFSKGFICPRCKHSIAKKKESDGVDQEKVDPIKEPKPIKRFKVKEQPMDVMTEASIRIPRAKHYRTKGIRALMARGIKDFVAEKMLLKKAPLWVKVSLVEAGVWQKSEVDWEPKSKKTKEPKQKKQK